MPLLNRYGKKIGNRTRQLPSQTPSTPCRYRRYLNHLKSPPFPSSPSNCHPRHILAPFSQPLVLLMSPVTATVESAGSDDANCLAEFAIRDEIRVLRSHVSFPSYRQTLVVPRCKKSSCSPAPAISSIVATVTTSQPPPAISCQISAAAGFSLPMLRLNAIQYILDLLQGLPRQSSTGAGRFLSMSSVNAVFELVTSSVTSLSGLLHILFTAGHVALDLVVVIAVSDT
ncbi:hypothetical protein PIB30_010386 [Stylosanthes scabra]|uniref:Uncharacterized protein n=1 Tax=Stylosanthes scabra TaxID=79078 RepID=A0ABU6W3I1_9FABA|nr:hypothetical protein [Stylosanthes scabra]